jgi:hypothetical protein
MWFLKFMDLSREAYWYGVLTDLRLVPAVVFGFCAAMAETL